MIKFLLLALLFGIVNSQSGQEPTTGFHLHTKGESDMKKEHEASHPYVGMWVTEDGYIRHELLTNGRYDEARGERNSAYQGSYTVTGNHIEYVDDTGFSADGDFVNGVLYHAGMVLYREEQYEGSKE